MKSIKIITFCFYLNVSIQKDPYLLFRSLKWEEIEFDGGNPCEDKDMGSEEIKSFLKQL